MSFQIHNLYWNWIVACSGERTTTGSNTTLIGRSEGIASISLSHVLHYRLFRHFFRTLRRNQPQDLTDLGIANCISSDNATDYHHLVKTAILPLIDERTSLSLTSFPNSYFQYILSTQPTHHHDR